MAVEKKYDIKKNGNIIETFHASGDFVDNDVLPKTNYQYQVRVHEVDSGKVKSTSEWTAPINVKTK
ncbi:hypothetical protein LP114_109 [Listeria phage LP-114]|uniref:Fibronectin type III domain-containing protein n=1 Tax=Listeria phage LP-114 TaxID=1458857 RepID=A0A059T6C0_9CAUD|nr:hypothetical protein LP114_109 [Listeria phage LP-114]AHL18697.1 hypothetical protein LP114_109 [Listeria phage LP-114]